jgi:hypothetical protein
MKEPSVDYHTDRPSSSPIALGPSPIDALAAEPRKTDPHHSDIWTWTAHGPHYSGRLDLEQSCCLYRLLHIVHAGKVSLLLCMDHADNVTGPYRCMDYHGKVGPSFLPVRRTALFLQQPC